MDQAMESLGEHGPFQRLSIVIIVLSSILCTFYSAIIAYLTKLPEFLCRDPGMGPNEAFHQCAYSKDLCYSNIEIKKDYENSVHNWAYSFDLYCSREKYIPFISTAFFTGGVSACLTLSKVPDMYGRKKPFTLMMIFSLLLQVSLLFTIGPVHGIITFLLGGYSSFAYAMVSYIISEFLPPSYTGPIMGIANASYPIFGVMTGFFFLFINNWRLLFFIITTVHTIITFLIIKYFPESPRWLVSKGRKDECIEVMRYIAKMNSTSANFEEFLKKNKKVFDPPKTNKKQEENTRTYSLLQVLSFKSQRKNFLILSYLWFSSCFCFFGIILNLGRMEGGFFALSIMAFTGEGFAEISSGILSGIFGRVFIMKYCSYIGSIGFLLYIFLPKEIGCILVFISMAGYAASYNVIYIYTPEVFPTPIRGMCCNVLFLLCRFSPLFVSPLTSIFGDNVNYIFILFGLVNGFANNFLEETLGKPLPDEIPEEIGNGSGLLASFQSGSEKFDVVSSFASQSFYYSKF